MTTRREFLGSMALAAAGPAEWRNRQSAMAYRRLGRTNYMISEFVCGGNTISPTNHEHVETHSDHCTLLLRENFWTFLGDKNCVLEMCGSRAVFSAI